MDHLTEQEIIQLAYSLLEQDNTYWATDSAEYLTARNFFNAAVMRWEHYNNTVWKALITKLSDAGSGTTTISAATFSYACPTSMARPVSWVRTTDSAGIKRWWKPIPANKLAAYAESDSDICYFLGNRKDGFTLNFNSRATLPTAGATIEYELMKKATRSAAITTKPELPDPNFIAYWIAAHMSDGGINIDFMEIAENLLEQMEDQNESGLELVPDNIDQALGEDVGFGI